MKNINLFDYKQELKRIATQKRVVWAVEIVMLAVFLIIVYCGFQQVEIAYSKTELEKLETRVKSLAAETTKIQSMKMQAKRVTEITEKIRELRAKQFQVTQVLEGLTLSIPDEVWLTSVRQLTLKDVVSMKGPIIFFGDLQQRMPKKGKRGKKKRKKEDRSEFLEVRGRALGEHGNRIITGYVDGLRKVSHFKGVSLHRIQRLLGEADPVSEFTLYIHRPV